MSVPASGCKGCPFLRRHCFTTRTKAASGKVWGCNHYYNYCVKLSSRLRDVKPSDCDTATAYIREYRLTATRQLRQEKKEREAKAAMLFGGGVLK